MPEGGWTAQFWEEFEPIIADAYKDSRSELDRVIEPAINIHSERDLIGAKASTREVVAALREALQARDQLIGKALSAFYVALPGNAALRGLAKRWLPEEDQGKVPDAVFERERAAYERRRFSRDQETAVRGLDALRENATDAVIAGILRNSAAMLEEAMQTLQRVKAYKQLHDHLHSLQTDTLSGFATILLRQELDALSKMEITLLAGAAPKMLDQLTETATSLKGMNADFNDAWIANIAQVLGQLEPMDRIDRERLRQITSKLRSALSIPMTNLNQILIATAGRIPFKSLAELLGAAAGTSVGETAERLLAAQKAIRQIDAGLGKAIGVHDQWQTLDDALWAFEPFYAMVAFDPTQRESVAEHWHGRIVGPAERLTADDAMSADKIRRTAAAFDTAMSYDPPTIAALGIAYVFFANAVRERFFWIDRDLLNQCTSLMGLEPGLRALTREQG